MPSSTSLLVKAFVLFLSWRKSSFTVPKFTEEEWNRLVEEDIVGVYNAEQFLLRVIEVIHGPESPKEIAQILPAFGRIIAWPAFRPVYAKTKLLAALARFAEDSDSRLSTLDVEEQWLAHEGVARVYK